MGRFFLFQTEFSTGLGDMGRHLKVNLTYKDQSEEGIERLTV